MFQTLLVLLFAGTPAPSIDFNALGKLLVEHTRQVHDGVIVSNDEGWSEICIFGVCGDCHTDGPTGDSMCWIQTGSTHCAGSCTGGECSGGCHTSR